MTTPYSTQDYIDVSTKNDVRVCETGDNEYILHQFKNFVGSGATGSLNWQGQSQLAASVNPILLQMFNHVNNAWETLLTNSTALANTDFDMVVYISDFTNYLDVHGKISCRVYQRAN